MLTKKRTIEVELKARTHGFLFSEKGNDNILKDIPTFPLFLLTDSRFGWESNVMRIVENSNQISILDLTHKSSEHTDYRTLTIAYFKNNSLDLPKFFLRPENFMDKIIKKFGYKDVNFDQHPEFSKSYLLHGEEENRIRTLFLKSSILYFLAKEKRFVIESNGKSVIVYKVTGGGVPRIIPVAELDEFIRTSKQVFEMLSK